MKFNYFVLILTGIFLASAIVASIFASAAVGILNTEVNEHSFTQEERIDLLNAQKVIIDVVSEDVRFFRTEENYSYVRYEGEQKSLSDEPTPMLDVRTYNDELLIDVNYEDSFFSGIFSQRGNIDIFIGKDVSFNHLAIDSVSGLIEIENEAFNELAIDTVSGEVLLGNISAEQVFFDTISGDITYVGSFTDATIFSVSGDADMDLNSAFNRLDFDSVSGDVTVKTDGMRICDVYLDTVSGSVYNELPIDGPCTGKVYGDTTSGDIRLSN